MNMRNMIFDKTDTVGFPYSPELFEWLTTTSPQLGYRVVRVY